jgi:hypothetical protein
MAINRKDTPLANTPDPTIDPTVKRTVTVNPNGTKTYRMSWANTESKSTPARRSSGTASKSRVASKGTSKGTSGTSSSKTTYNEREITTLPEMKTKGLIEKKGAEIKPLDANKIVTDKRTWQDKRKQEERRKEYNRYRQGDESFSEYRDRAKKSSEEISRKAKDRSKGLHLSGGMGGGGCGC